MGTRAPKGSVVVREIANGAWEGCVERGLHPKTGKRWRARIRRDDRQEAVHLTLKCRSKAHILRRGRDVNSKPSTAAEWFWLWLWNEHYRKAARIHRADWEPFVMHFMPHLDERSLDDLHPTEIARLINGIPTWDAKTRTHRVVAAALETARERRWVAENAALCVRVVPALPPQLVFDDNDPAFDRPADPGTAIVRER